MARLWQRTRVEAVSGTLAGILIGTLVFILIVSCLTPNTLASSWNTGLNLLVVLSPTDDADLSALHARLTRLLALTTTDDQVTIVTGPSANQQVSLDDQRSIDLPTLEHLLKPAALDDAPQTLSQLLGALGERLATAGKNHLQPILLFLDYQGTGGTGEEAELASLLDQFTRVNCLLTGIRTGPKGELERVIEGCGGLTFSPENKAAEHRALVNLFAGARSSSWLTIRNGYLPIDQSCQQLTLLLNSQSGPPQVARPNGSLLDADDDRVLWTTGSNGVTITVSDPEPGYWRILGDDCSGGAILTSPLKLGRMPLLSTYAVGEPMTLLAYLADGDRLSPDPYPYILTLRAELLGPSQSMEELLFYDDGQHGDGGSRDGLYGAQMQPNIPGTYQLSYELERGLLARQESVSFKVAEPDGQERRYTLVPQLINLPRLVPGRTYQQTITLTSHLAKAESFRFQIGDDDTDVRSFGELVVSPSEIELQPGESRTITLAVRLQPKAALGGYAGHLRLVPVSAMQRGQIVPLRLGLVPWPIAHWPWLAAGGVGLFAAMVTAGVVLSRPQLHGCLSNEATGGRERVLLHGHHFLPSPTSHRSYLMASHHGGSIRVHLCVDPHDPPVLLNGLPVTRSSPLNDGDQLRFGQVIWEYREGTQESVQEPAAGSNPQGDE